MTRQFPDLRDLDHELPPAPEPFLIRHSEKIAAVLILCIWAVFVIAQRRLKGA